MVKKNEILKNELQFIMGNYENGNKELKIYEQYFNIKG